MEFKKWMKRAVQHLTGQELERIWEEKSSISERMKEGLKLWCAMYDNTPPWTNERVKSLNLPAAIAAETARLATIELRSEITGSERAAYLNKMYQPVLAQLRRYVEYGCAKGGLVMKPYVSGGRILIDFIQADDFYPMAFDSSGRITAAVFTDRFLLNGKIYTRLECHEMKEDGYCVRNRAFVSRVRGNLGREVPLNEVAEWENVVQEVTIQNIKSPLFAYFKVPYANAVDTDSPLGVSDMAFRLDEKGRAQIPDKRLYRLLGIDQGGDDLFSDWTPNLREENILRGLNAILRKIEFNCGLAYGTLSDVDNVDKTAEEIRASKQRSYSMICDVQKSLRLALCELIDAMNVLCSLYHLAPEGICDKTFDFDDSIVADRATEFSEKQQLLQEGILQPWEFRMWYFGESEQRAKEAVGERVFKMGDK